ncbi:MAG: substrate-binding domain-containing protein [Persephonella sp.]|nr:substrate-binding domain-containing protein [Persephonella sp.]
MRYLIIFLLSFFTVSYGDSLKIAAAANVQYPLRELIKLFESRYPDVRVVTVISSSGKLTAQIERGAPYHIFMSANMKYPEYLYRKGLAPFKTPCVCQRSPCSVEYEKYTSEGKRNEYTAGRLYK